MADIIYTVNQDNPDFIPGFEQYLQTDKDLVSTFEINNLFDPGLIDDSTDGSGFLNSKIS
jgi:hypothetical protein